MIALLLPLKPVPTWLLSFSGLALDFQLPLAGIVIAFCALVSAIFSVYFTRENRRRSSLSDVEIAMELVESEIEQSFIEALVMANYGIDEKESADLLFRVVMRNRKVYAE